MKRNILSESDGFSNAPFLSLLPGRTPLGKSTNFQAALFARFERVTQEADNQMNNDAESSRRISAERQMLSVVLDWLAERGA